MEEPKVLRGHVHPINALAVDSDIGISVSSSIRPLEGTCLIHNIRNGVATNIIEIPHGSIPNLIRISIEGFIVFYSEMNNFVHVCDCNGRRWKNLNYGSEVLEHSGRFSRITCLILDKSGSLIASGDSHGNLFVRRVFDLKVIQTFDNLPSSISSISFSGSAENILCACSNSVFKLELDMDRVQRALRWDT